ncbi:ABC transporter substrate binding protein [Desulfotalea psychrophila]|uniref:histidine kinase n=1 Tax=Desulfotalea psychrophila (strain LSv54 / DSM 12343) TaxID=177439 RepID=Q6ALX2_DESPS|nr:ABC transporter substrate binding protein [Desulfotalea psychrophila]CAG36653.1 related to two-component system sensory/regulatory protein (Ntr family), probably cold-shock inducible [Desulfotalea psychrophila LSv54]
MNFFLRSILHFFYPCLLIALLWATPSFAAEIQKEPDSRQVLIVQSGYEGYPWTDSQNKGIQDVFSAAPQPTDFFFEYIDTKRNHGKAYLKNLQKFWEIKYRNQQIDLIITCDNQAYEFIIKNRISLFQNIPLVFAGMNKFKPAMLRGKRLVTGVTEENDLEATIDIALRLHPKTKKLVFIIPGAQPYRLQWFKDLPVRYREEVEQIIITARELDEIDRELDSLGPNLVAILLNSVVVRDGIYMSFEKFVIHLATNRPFPLYTLWDNTLGQGIVGGKLIRGELQGRKAAELALKILRGIPVAELPILEKIPNQYMFDWHQLQRFNIDISDLPAEAVVVNRPISFYAQNKRLVQVTLSGIFLLLLLVISLATAVINLKKAQKKVFLSDDILEQMPEAIVLTGMDGNIEKWLGRAEEIFGYSESDCLGRALAFNQSSELNITEQIEAGIEKSSRFLGEIACLRKDGTSVPIEVTSTRAFSRSGIAVGTISILQDISERREAKESLRASEDRFRKMIAKSPMPTMLTNQNYDIAFVNDKFTELFGYRLEDIETGRKWWKSAYPDANYRRRAEEGWRVAIKKMLAGDADMARQEWDLTVKDGSVRRCEFYMVPIEDLSLVIVNDISQRVREASEKNKLELRLRQAQKMEAIGALAGGIAHDFNNILAVILGYAELAKDEIPANSIIGEDLDQVIEGGNRAKELVKQILAFSRQEKVKRLPLQVQVLLKETMRMLRPSLPSTIEIQTEIDPLCGFVLADPTQVHQIIMNLCTNANHAMEKSGGRLDIELKRISVDEGNRHKYSSLVPGDYVVLVVADTGEGIAPHNIGKIFEPYFTTKEIGKGTGMGLATIHGIIREYGGIIDVASDPEHGSVFSVFFPVITTEKVVADTVAQDSPQDRGRILLVDDEKLLLTVIQKVLARLDYRVTTKSSSLEALTIFKESPDAFDAIITDQTMPDMVGSDLAQEILKIRADIPIILCTGYSDQFDADRVHSLGIREFALKPLTKGTLAHLLSRVLGDY